MLNTLFAGEISGESGGFEDKTKLSKIVNLILSMQTT